MTETEKAEEKAAPKEAEKPNELEEDAPPDTRKKLGKEVCINPLDTTLDVMPAFNGKLIQGLSDGGFHYLLSGARANVGVKSGRYAFEVTLLERVFKDDAPRDKPAFFKVGFSTAKSTLFMNEQADSFSFDSEGMFSHSPKTKVFQSRIARAEVITVVINLKQGAPNGNTVSLFKNGKRLTEPQAIPENFSGKALYPTITFKNVTLLVNFGPSLTKALPFKVTTLAEVAAEDAEVSSISAPKDGKFEVHYSVGMPDEGTCDFVDQFLEKNPNFVELSDRAIAEWATQSGLTRQKEKAYNDKFAAGFGFSALLDDLSVHKMLQTLAPVTQRNFVVMDIANNLTESGRKDALQRFSGPQWKKVAQVAIGSPPADFKKHVQKLILADKQKVLNTEYAKKVAEREKVKEASRRKKAAEKAAAMAKEKREAAIKKAKKIREKKEKAAKKAAERKEMGLEGPFSESEDEPEEEVKPPEEPAEEAPEEPMEPCPQAELNEDDLKVMFRDKATKDLAPQAVAKIFRHVCLPDQAEGFDEIKYCWEKKEGASAYLREWILKNKRDQRIEDLTPGEWFKEKWAAWSKECSELKRKQTEFKTKGKVSKPEKEKEGEDGEEENQEEEKANGEEMVEIDIEDLDVLAVEDIDDINRKGQPLYAKFEFEDWALLSIRFELYALVKSFAKDLGDPDIPGVTEPHLGYYYHKYFKKQLTIKGYGVEGMGELVALVKDAISVNATSKVLETSLPDDTEFAKFVKLTEENRRERERRVDAGDETARLKFARSVNTGGGPVARPTGTPATAKGPSKAAPKGTSPTGASRYSGGARASYYGSAAPTSSLKRPGGPLGGQPAKVGAHGR